MFDDTRGFEHRGGVTPQSVRYSLVDVAASLMKVSREEFIQAPATFFVGRPGWIFRLKYVDFTWKYGVLACFSYEK